MGNKKDAIRNEVHDWALELRKKGYKYPAIILLLSTWNFAYFRYILTSFNLNSFKRKLEKLEKTDLKFFDGRKFENVDLNSEKIRNRIEKIYRILSDSGIAPVGATKVMYLLNPNVFVMWDNGIISHYRTATKKNRKITGKIDNSPEGYFNFMRLMQKYWKEDKFRKSKGKETIPRTIDLYNWKHYRTTKKQKR